MSAPSLFRAGILVLTLAALGACNQHPAPRYKEYRDEAAKVDLVKPPASLAKPLEEPSAAAADASAAAAAAPAAAPGPDGVTHTTVPAGTPMLAYSYAFGVEAAAGNVRALEARHEAACTSAGAAVCQVTGSNLTEQGEGRVHGQLSLRATPAWVARFRNGLPEDAKTAGGRLTKSDVSSEDLSRDIVDTEAALKAKTTLRDRLQQLLATHPGKLSDLLDVERELSTVQGEIDATQSELTMMQARVATSEVTVEYDSSYGVASASVWSPLSGAFGDVGGIIAGTLGFMVRLIAFLAPWALVIGGLGWVFRKRLGRLAFWRRRPATPPAADPPV